MNYRILLIFIAIEALDISISNQTISINKIEIKKKYNKVNQYHLNPIIYLKYKLLILYLIKHNPHLSIIAKCIIQQYNSEIGSNICNKYVKRFKYLYYKLQQKYIYQSLSYDNNITEIAIQNLYMIYIIYKTNKS